MFPPPIPTAAPSSPAPSAAPENGTPSAPATCAGAAPAASAALSGITPAAPEAPAADAPSPLAAGENGAPSASATPPPPSQPLPPFLLGRKRAPLLRFRRGVATAPFPHSPRHSKASLWRSFEYVRTLFPRFRLRAKALFLRLRRGVAIVRLRVPRAARPCSLRRARTVALVVRVGVRARRAL